MDQQPPMSSLNASGEELAWNVSRRQLLQLSTSMEEEPLFVGYKPPARDAITLPRNVVYVLLGVVVIAATYGVVGHLIKDLMHDFAGKRFWLASNISPQPPRHPCQPTIHDHLPHRPHRHL